MRKFGEVGRLEPNNGATRHWMQRASADVSALCIAAPALAERAKGGDKATAVMDPVRVKSIVVESGEALDFSGLEYFRGAPISAGAISQLLHVSSRPLNHVIAPLAEKSGGGQAAETWSKPGVSSPCPPAPGQNPLAGNKLIPAFCSARILTLFLFLRDVGLETGSSSAEWELRCLSNPRGTWPKSASLRWV